MAKCDCGNEAEGNLGAPIDICKECYDKIMGEAEAAIDGPHPEDGIQTDVVYEARTVDPTGENPHHIVVKKYRDSKGRRVTHFMCSCISAHDPGKDAAIIAMALNNYTPEEQR